MEDSGVLAEVGPVGYAVLDQPGLETPQFDPDQAQIALGRDVTRDEGAEVGVGGLEGWEVGHRRRPCGTGGRESAERPGCGERSR